MIVGAVGLAYFAVARGLSAQNGPFDEWQDQGSPVFTPAHRTIWDAVLDFFDYRPQAVQPIQFPHKVHIANGLQCVMCHAGVDKGPDARIPSVKFCMTCHRVIAKNNPEIKKLAAYYNKGQDVPWQGVYGFAPEAHVFFNHAPHIRAGVSCSKCHGDMTKQTVAVRSVNLTMGYCVKCHEQHGASVDCVTCHY
ncbi:MAG: cytochrome c3 family protein [Candidatus Acidiferrales bacterium]